MGRFVRMRDAVLLLASVVAALALATPAGAQVSCGATVTTAAKLTQDLDCDASTAPAVTVASGAVLDMAGHTITCTAGTNPGVQVAGDGATVKSGVVTGCQTGVLVSGNRNRVRDVVVSFSAATYFGIRVAGDENLVRRCAVRDAVSAAFAIAGRANRVVRNVGVGGGEATYNVASGDDNVLTGNLSYFANANGFLVGASALRTVLRDNSAVVGELGYNVGGNDSRLANNVALDQQSTGFGISFDSSGNRLRNNAAVFSVEGIDVVGAASVLRENSALGNATLGIVMRGANNTATRNLAIGNGSYDLSDVSCQNNWLANRFGTADAVCIE